MYYYRKNSKRKILHTASCYHKGRIGHGFLASMELDKAILSGYRFCKCCDPIGKKFRAEQKKLMDYGRKNALSIHWNRRGISIVTPWSQWLIVRTDSEEETELYHRNHFPEKRGEKELYPGYHAQNKVFPDLYHYLEYIVQHDDYRMCHPAKPSAARREPPKKGTKRYKKAQKLQKKRQRREAARNVLDLIDHIAS